MSYEDQSDSYSDISDGPMEGGGLAGPDDFASGVGAGSSGNTQSNSSKKGKAKAGGSNSKAAKEAAAAAAAEEKDVKKRSSKACDNCRKSKCKCARIIDQNTGQPIGSCENCVQVGAECTYNGASRKRGPPKGYIEAIESRLHRMEALLGGLLQNDDPRAQALLGELIGDDEARDVLTQDLKAASTAPPGSKTRKSWKKVEETANTAPTVQQGFPPSTSTVPFGQFNADPKNWAFTDDDMSFGGNGIGGVGGSSLGFDTGSFRDPLTAGNDGASEESGSMHGASPGPFRTAAVDIPSSSSQSGSNYRGGGLGSISLPPPQSNESNSATSPRQRRRLNHQSPLIGTSNLVGANVDELKSLSYGFSSQTNQRHVNSQQVGHTGTASYSLSAEAELSPSNRDQREGSEDPMSGMSELADVVGQLSLNENSEVRYHGRSSGLYLISKSARYKDFFWQFPSAGVWPPAEGRVQKTEKEVLEVDNIEDALPDRATQQHLIDLYWAYVHPHFPIIYKVSFLRQLRHQLSKPDSTERSTTAGQGRVPTVLLLAMFALASRYSDVDGNRVEGKYWTAGEVYLERAKKLLDYNYGSSKLVTVQALLLMAYREIGTGAMSSSWLYTGMAIRMAQDLGLFRDVEKWFLPVQKFSHEEKQTRKRVWWGCIILDRYTASYIGRPGTIHERDYDTSFPSEDEPDEHEQFVPLRPDGTEWTVPPKSDESETVDVKPYPQAKVHAMSCFNAAGALAVVINRIIANIYAIRVRVLGQSSETLLSLLDQSLASWYLALPPQLVYNPSSKKVPPPHVLSLHLQFYSALILLHRPFIPGQNSSATLSSFPSHSICTTSAIAIANIVNVFRKTFTLRQCPPFLTYPIFSAAVICVYNASFDDALAQPAKFYLAQCMTALKEMELIWGSAIRQWELLHGLVDLRDADLNAELETIMTDDDAALRGTKRAAESDFNNLPPTNFHARPLGRQPSNAKPRRKSSSAGRAKTASTTSSLPTTSPLIPENPSASMDVQTDPLDHSAASNNAAGSSNAIPQGIEGMHDMFSQSQPSPMQQNGQTTASPQSYSMPRHQTYDILTPSGQMMDLSQFRSPPGTSAGFSDLLNSFLSPTENPAVLQHLPNSLQPMQGQSGGGAIQRGMFEHSNAYTGAFSGFPLGAQMTEEWANYLPNAFAFSPPDGPVNSGTAGQPGRAHSAISPEPTTNQPSV